MKNLISFFQNLWRDERGEFGMDPGGSLSDPEGDEVVAVDDESGDDDDGGEGAPAKAAKQEDPEDKPVTRKEMDELVRQNAELKGAVEFWAKRAGGGKADEDEDDEAEEQPAPRRERGPAKMTEAEVSAFLTDVNTRGEVAIEDILQRKGYLRRADVQQMIRNEGSALIRNTELMREYPDLKNDKSPLFQRAAAELDNLKRSGFRGPDLVAQAVRNAELELRKRNEWDTGREETERQARVAQQAGPRGVRNRPASPRGSLNKREAFFAEQMGVPLKTALLHKQKHITDER